VLTIAIWAVMQPALFLLMAWAMARAARAVGSPRGKLRFGFLAVLFVVIINVVFIVLDARAARSARANDSYGTLARGLFLLLLQLGVIHVMLRHTFRLSGGRAFAPFGALIGVTILQIALAVFVIKPWVTEAFSVRNASMSPTIDDSDRFAVNKLLRPRRWDLVAYRNVYDDDGQPPETFCKRLIALPGERLRIEGGTIYINDKPADGIPPVLAGRCRAAMPGPGRRLTRYEDGQTIALAADEYFFIGDNLDISGDSRSYGPSKTSALVGVIDVIYWPPAKARIVR
jgi:signal peptidase I